MMIDVYVNGEWDISFKLHKEVVIYNKGQVFKMDKSLFDKFIDDLENEGYDCYFSPQLFRNPDWNGIIKFDED